MEDWKKHLSIAAIVTGLIIGIIGNFFSNVIWDGFTNNFQTVQKAIERYFDNKEYEKEAQLENRHTKKLSYEEICINGIINRIDSNEIEIGIFDDNTGNLMVSQSFDLAKKLKTTANLTQLNSNTSEGQFPKTNNKNNSLILFGHYKVKSIKSTKDITTNKALSNSDFLSAEIEIHFYLFDNVKRILIDQCTVTNVGLDSSTEYAIIDAVNRAVNLFKN